MATKTIKVSDMLKNKFDERGFASVPDFIQRTGCPLAPETIGASMFRDKKISAPSLIVFGHYLGFSPAEIKKLLIASGDTLFHQLIVESKQKPISAHHKAIIEAVDSITQKRPEMINDIAYFLENIANVIRVDISAQTKILQRKTRKTIITRRG